MLLVNARVGPSAIHGLGLIAREPIAAGARISVFRPGLDLTLSRAELEALPEPARSAFRYYSFRHVHTRLHVLSFDDDRFTNHSDAPNTDGRTALRAIADGEELTFDYRRWDLDFAWKLAGTPSGMEAALDAPDPEVRRAALRALAVDDADAAVARLGTALADPSPRVRLYAAKTLVELGAGAAAALPALARALGGEDARVRYYVAKCLARAGDLAGEALPALRAGLEDADPRIRAYCARTLSRLG